MGSYTVTSCCCSGCCSPDITWYVTFDEPGVTGNEPPEISGCEEMSDDTFELNWFEEVTPPYYKYWVSTGGQYVECVANGQGGNVEMYLTCPTEDVPYYSLEIRTSDSIGLALYQLHRDDWDCNECNTMNWMGEVAEDRCCNFPPTLTICPACAPCPAATVTYTFTVSGLTDGPCVDDPDDDPICEGTFWNNDWEIVGTEAGGTTGLMAGPVNACNDLSNYEIVIGVTCAEGFPASAREAQITFMTVPDGFAGYSCQPYKCCRDGGPVVNIFTRMETVYCPESWPETITVTTTCTPSAPMAMAPTTTLKSEPAKPRAKRPKFNIPRPKPCGGCGHRKRRNGS